MSRVGNESVLRNIENVRYKKKEGTLCVTNQGIRWYPNSTEGERVEDINLKFTEIRAQRVSPDTKPKVQLQVHLYDENSYVFHFASGRGNNRQSFEDRNAVKELLAQQLPLHHSRRNQELDEKIKVLEENETLFALYKDLVVSQVISADEFWKLRQAEPLMEKKKGLVKTGVSSSILSSLKPIMSQNGQKFVLTPDLISDIFRTYPVLEQRYTEFVKTANVVDHETFWKLGRFIICEYRPSQFDSTTGIRYISLLIAPWPILLS